MVRERSGLPLDPMFSATKARWLLDHFDPDRTRAARGDLCVGTVDAWILRQLTGEDQIEVGNASRTQLMDVRTCQWSPQLLDLFGMPVQALPDIVGSACPFGPRRGGDAIPGGVPVLAVMGDSHAALFGHAGWRPGLVKATYGTGSSVMAVSAGRAGPTSGLCETVAWQIGAEPARAVEGNIRSSGATLAWLAQLTSATPAQPGVDRGRCARRRRAPRAGIQRAGSAVVGPRDDRPADRPDPGDAPGERRARRPGVRCLPGQRPADGHTRRRGRGRRPVRGRRSRRQLLADAVAG